jgi:nitrogen fixation protein NifU and related proteins
MYTEKVLLHFQNPHNQGVIENADGVGQVGNPVCGDIMKIYLKLEDSDLPKEQRKIVDVKFETLGCGAAIASSSILTDIVKDKTVDEAGKITKQKVVDELGGLPHQKIHCSLLAVDALQKAISSIK